MLKLIQGHVLEVLAGMEPESVHCIVTSPPYWGLREYKTEPVIWGGDQDCDHDWGTEMPHGRRGKRGTSGTGGNKHPTLFALGIGAGAGTSGNLCSRCGAWRGSLGLEPLHDCLAWARGQDPCPVCYVCHIRTIWRALWRVLRKDGTCWLVIGDSYAAHPGQRKITDKAGPKQASNVGSPGAPSRSAAGLKPKDLCMIPSRVALALQSDGWYLRSKIIWAKPNPMPESVTDRPTRSHEHVILLTKSGDPSFWTHPFKRGVRSQPVPDYRWRHKLTGLEVDYPPVSALLLSRFWSRRNLWEAHDYYYDREAVLEPSVTQDPRRPYTSAGAWELDGRPISQRHGGKPRDSLPACYKGSTFHRGKTAEHQLGRAQKGGREEIMGRNLRDVWTIATVPYKGAHFAVFPPGLVEPCILAGTSERGCCPNCGAPWVRSGPRGLKAPPDQWHPGCECGYAPQIPCTVLDPFMGSGTVGAVSLRLGRGFIGIELNPDYLVLSRRRIAQSVARSRKPVSSNRKENRNHAP